MRPIFLALLLAAPAATAAEAPLAIRATAVWAGGGRVLENATVLIESGRIRALGERIDLPAGTEVLVHEGVLTAGLIALHGSTGAVGETADDTRPLLPEARIGLAVNPRHRDFAALAASGITTAVVTPSAGRLCGGTSAVLKTHGGTVLLDPAQLSISFSSAAISSGREPTSYAGAVALLREMFREPRGNAAEAAAGRLPCLFEVGARDDVRRAMAFAKQQRLRGALHGADLAGELAPEIAESKLAVILPPLATGTARRTLRSVPALAAAGVPLGFGLDAPWNHPETLRLSAVLCVQAGLDRQAAWDALTASAARIAGVDERVGKIERGLDADLVLWSGDPLDLASAPVRVFVGGRVAYEQEASR